MFLHPNISYEFGPFRLDTRERRLIRNGDVVPLTPKVFDVLLVLVQNSGRLLSKDDVMRLVWLDTAVEEGSVTRSISTLRNALGEGPREQHFIETVPWRGYRFVAAVRQVDTEIGLSINSIAVLPFVNEAGDPDFDYFTDGITEAVINKLAQLTQLRVMSRNSTFRYKGLETNASMVGRELNVLAVVTGRVARRDDLLSISVAVVDARDDSHIWGSQYVRPCSEAFELQEKIAHEVASQLRLRLSSDEEKRLNRRQTDKSEAYDLYLKGRYHFNKLTVEGVQKAVDHFKQAIEIDPRYALAYVGLGDCYNYSAKPADARESMIKALDLDGTLAEAHASLGFFKFVYDWDFEGAEAELKRALELNPNYAEAHHWSAIYFANIGRHDEAAVEARLATELDPLSLLMNMTPAMAMYLARDYDAAVRYLRDVIYLEPNFLAAHSVLGNAYVQQGLYDEAMAEYQKVLDLSKGVVVIETSMKAVIAHAYARAGDRAKARKLLEELLSDSQKALQPIVSPHSIAEIYAALGDIDQAFTWLDKAYDAHDMQMVSLKANPTLDSLRDDSRFIDVIRRVGLPQ